jgi:hypothetical protein
MAGADPSSTACSAAQSKGVDGGPAPTMTLPHSHISATEKNLPLPLLEGVGGRGFTQYSCDITPPPRPLPQGEGEVLLHPAAYSEMCECHSTMTGLAASAPTGAVILACRLSAAVIREQTLRTT